MYIDPRIKEIEKTISRIEKHTNDNYFYIMQIIDKSIKILKLSLLVLIANIIWFLFF